MKSLGFLFFCLVILPLVLLILVLRVVVPRAQDMTASHQQGQHFTAGLLADTQTAARSTNPQKVPQFQTSTPPEESINSSVFESRARQALRSSEGGKFLLESHHKRPTFKIDADRDPLMVHAKTAIQNPHQTLEMTVKAHGKEGSVSALTFTCEEEGDPYPEACIIRIHPEIRLRYEKIFLRCHHWGWSDARKVYNEYLSHPFHRDVYDWEWKPDINLRHEHYRNEYRYQKCFEATNEEGRVSFSDPTDISAQEYQDYLAQTQTAAGQIPPLQIVHPEFQESSCLVLEDLVEKGVCQYGEKICLEPEETRVIRGVSITRDCWAYRQTYRCIEPLPRTNTCQALRAKGCVQMSSQCKIKKHSICLVYQQTYSCQRSKKGLQKLSTQGGTSPFCLTGNCSDTSYEANGEMFEAISHLAVLKEAQDDIRKNIGIFKGEDRRCTRNCINFRDCCGVGKGWGMSLGLVGCSGNEKDLALKRSQKKCVQIGTFCAKKLLGECLEKKTAFCCFGTKLARLIQEAGHQQLGLSWGTPEHPNCQGFSPEQLSQMDFSRVDFSELFQDIANNFKPKGQKALSHSISTDRLKDTMTRLIPSKTQKEKRP